nr:MAG TPA: hypothetical protein [Caudoviricetes sp.]
MCRRVSEAGMVRYFLFIIKTTASTSALMLLVWPWK